MFPGGLLITVDGDDPVRTRAAVAQAIASCAHAPDSKLHLLSVQPEVNGHVAQYFGERELQQLQQIVADEELAPARALLDTARLPYSVHVRVGRRAETIAIAARELRCATVLMGPDRASMASRLFGSVAAQVRLLLAATGSRYEVIGS